MTNFYQKEACMKRASLKLRTRFARNYIFFVSNDASLKIQQGSHQVSFLLMPTKKIPISRKVNIFSGLIMGMKNVCFHLLNRFAQENFDATRLNPTSTFFECLYLGNHLTNSDQTSLIQLKIHNI